MSKKRLLLLTAIASLTLSAAPIRSLSGLTGITFWEVTSAATPFGYSPDDIPLTSQLTGNLSANNLDFSGAQTEFYDVFYSDANGAFNIDGEYITIQAQYPGPGGGLNIAEVELIFSVGPSQFANSVTSSTPGATNYVAASLGNIIDANLGTHTVMGVNAENERLSITVGFAAQQEPSQVPEPSSFVLAAIGAAGLFGRRLFERSRKTGQSR